MTATKSKRTKSKSPTPTGSIGKSPRARAVRFTRPPRRARDAGVPNKARATKAPATYQGKPIEATRLFVRSMPQFKNCKAETYMAVNEKNQTVTFVNVYNGLLKASYQPDHYTYAFNPKLHNEKMEEMEEVEVVDFPSFVVNAHSRRKG
jgi:hypothetical protein